jgi:hypothetical protein
MQLRVAPKSHQRFIPRLNGTYIDSDCCHVVWAGVVLTKSFPREITVQTVARY